MRIKVSGSKANEAGGALLISMIIVALLGVSLGSYLTLVSRQNESVMRSLAWNSAVPAMEAGIEEALTQLWYNEVTQLAVNGWLLMPDGWYQKTANLGNGFGYVVRIEPLDPPNIVSTGIAPAPFGQRALGTTDAAILSAAVDRANFVQRSLRVTTLTSGRWPKGMVAKGKIDLNGNSVSSDSFDSEDDLWSTNGKYDPTKRKDNGDIATNSGLLNSLDVGNADVMGHVGTGPGGSVSIGANGTVGDKIWVTTGRKGIKPGYATHDMNVSFPPVDAPFTSGDIPGGGTVDGETYDYILDQDRNYYLSSLSGKVLVTGDAKLYVSSSVKLSGQDFMTIKDGGSLEMYVAAASASLGGNGVINEGGRAEDFKYYGLPSNTSLDYGGNASFTGVIYAPDAAFSLGGGGKDEYDFVGSSITASVVMNGHFKFHYDEAIGRNQKFPGYIPNSWNEMPRDFGLPAAAFAYVSLEGYDVARDGQVN